MSKLEDQLLNERAKLFNERDCVDKKSYMYRALTGQIQANTIAIKVERKRLENIRRSKKS